MDMNWLAIIFGLMVFFNVSAFLWRHFQKKYFDRKYFRPPALQFGDMYSILTKDEPSFSICVENSSSDNSCIKLYNNRAIIIYNKIQGDYLLETIDMSVKGRVGLLFTFKDGNIFEVMVGKEHKRKIDKGEEKYIVTMLLKLRRLYRDYNKKKNSEVG